MSADERVSLGDKVSVYLVFPTGSGVTVLFSSNFQELFSLILEKPIRTLMMLWIVCRLTEVRSVSLVGAGLASPDDAWY